MALSSHVSSSLAWRTPPRPTPVPHPPDPRPPDHVMGIAWSRDGRMALGLLRWRNGLLLFSSTVLSGFCQPVKAHASVHSFWGPNCIVNSRAQKLNHVARLRLLSLFSAISPSSLVHRHNFLSKKRLLQQEDRIGRKSCLHERLKLALSSGYTPRRGRNL